MTDIKYVELIMYMFHITRGNTICMVYDSSKSSLNNSIWTPYFLLPIANSMPIGGTL